MAQASLDWVPPPGPGLCQGTSWGMVGAYGLGRVLEAGTALPCWVA